MRIAEAAHLAAQINGQIDRARYNACAMDIGDGVAIVSIWDKETMKERHALLSETHWNLVLHHYVRGHVRYVRG